MNLADDRLPAHGVTKAEEPLRDLVAEGPILFGRDDPPRLPAAQIDAHVSGVVHRQGKALVVRQSNIRADQIGTRRACSSGEMRVVTARATRHGMACLAA